MKAKRNRGPYTLPLPPLPGYRPAWFKQGYADWQGKRVTPEWALRYPKIKHYSHENAWEMPETTHDRGRYGGDVPVRSGGVQAWDHETARWVACKDRNAVRRYLRKVAPWAPSPPCSLPSWPSSGPLFTPTYEGET